MQRIGWRRVLFIWLALTALAAGGRGLLLVNTYGKLLLVTPEGSTVTLSGSGDLAAWSPDGRYVAYTDTNRVLRVVAPAGGPAREIARLPSGARFEAIGWRLDGAALAWEAVVPGKGDELWLSPMPPQRGGPRNLGPWYQGFSFAPDGTNVVHAVNGPLASGLEVLALTTGHRALVYKTRNVVWDARYSPDGHWIAYLMSLDIPPGDPEEPHCEPPPIGLWVLAVRERTAARITVRSAPPDWETVKNFAWSPDSRQIALTLGTNDCDYPGSAAGVFLISLATKQEKRISRSPMSFEPVFSPDGSALAFVDFSRSPATLVSYDLHSGSWRNVLRATAEDNLFHLLDWR